LISDNDKNGGAAAVCAAMALLSGALPAEYVLAAGVAAGVCGMVFFGAARGFALLAPLFLYSAGGLAPAVYAMTAAMFFADEDKTALRVRFAYYLIGGAAGLSYSCVAASGQCLFHWPGAIAALIVASLAMELASAIPAGERFALAVKPVSAALALYLMSQLDPGGYVYSESLPTGLALSTALGGAAYAEKKIDTGGLIMGIAAGTVMYVSLGLGGFVMLFSFVALSIVATAASSKARGLDKSYSVRGMGNVAANLGPAAAFAIASLFSDNPHMFNVGFCACLGAALSDTVSSEIGIAYGKRHVDIVTRAQTAAGVNGAVSMEGSLAGLMGAVFMAIASVTAELASPSEAWIVLAGGTLGFFADSWLGSVYENDGLLTNDAVNAWATFAGGTAAMALGLAFL